jgi:hypothetical protein
MAQVQLSDVIVPPVFANYMMIDTMEMSKVFSSGLVEQDAEITRLLGGGGLTFDNPYLGDLDNTEATTATDNPADIITPGKLGSGKFRFRRQFRTRAWSTMDLVKELAGTDPMQRIAGRVGALTHSAFVQ